MHAALSAFFTWLLKKRRIKTNPCASLVRPDAPKARARVLASKEIVSFWRATDSERTPVGAALKILLLTGARLREVNEMRREELSDDCATWTIPGSRTKNGREHVVPLPPLARDVLASIPGKGSYIFSANGRQPVALGSAAKSNIDRAMGVSDWVFHDLRRTFVTGLAELGVRPDVIELAVNHVSGHRGGIAGVYNKSELLPERRAALERWSSHIEGLLSGKAAKVLPLLRAEA
jgi:integrase